MTWGAGLPGSGSPDSVSNSSPSRAARKSLERKLSARACSMSRSVDEAWLREGVASHLPSHLVGRSGPLLGPNRPHPHVGRLPRIGPLLPHARAGPVQKRRAARPHPDRRHLAQTHGPGLGAEGLDITAVMSLVLAKQILDTSVGDVLPSIEALRVAGQQDLHTVTSPLRDLGGVDARVEPGRQCRVPSAEGRTGGSRAARR